ncbi:MAG: DUF4433 domain-containing protein [Bacteroidota bacterium]
MANRPLKHIFRMIHIDNMPHVIEVGLTHRQSQNASKNFRPIGDATLISTRHTKLVQIVDSKEWITLGDYVPFYFGVRTPMLYVMQLGGNYVPNKVSPEDIIYCVMNLSTLIDKDFTFYFSDGHATDGFTQFYSHNRFDVVHELVDVKATRVKWWSDGEDRDLKRRKQAELLVRGDIPFDCLAGFIVYNDAAKSRLLQMGILAENVHIEPNFYF